MAKKEKKPIIHHVHLTQQTKLKTKQHEPKQKQVSWKRKQILLHKWHYRIAHVSNLVDHIR